MLAFRAKITRSPQILDFFYFRATFRTWLPNCVFVHKTPVPTRLIEEVILVIAPAEREDVVDRFQYPAVELLSLGRVEVGEGMFGVQLCSEENILRAGIPQAGDQLGLREEPFDRPFRFLREFIHQRGKIREGEFYFRRGWAHPADVLTVTFLPFLV